MAAEKLNDATIKKVIPPEKGYTLLWDSEVRGFAARITAAGARSFIVNYRAENGRERRMTIGSFPDWSSAAAREKAKEIKRRVDAGEDPMQDRHETRLAPTVADLAEEYLTKYAEAFKRPGSVKEDRDMLKHVLPALGKMKVASVTLHDVEDLHRKMSETPVRANRVHALVRKIFSLAIKWNYRADNPAVGVQRYREEARTRYLSGDELQRLSAVLVKHPNRQSANAIRLLLLTGARRGEVLGATWAQFDLAAGVWVKPSSHVKQKKEHRIPLSAPALQLLVEMKDNSSSEFLFPGRDTPVAQAGIKNFWKNICKEAEITDCHIHDLRHTYASILASAGLSLPIIGALLGHTQAATTQRYAHLMDDPLRAATERAGAVISGAAHDNSADVIHLRK